MIAWLLAAQLFSSGASDAIVKDLDTKQENWLFSPLSIHACLSMAASGANGETADEFQKALSLPEHIEETYATLLSNLKQEPASERDFQLKISQGIWVESKFPLMDAYIDSMQSAFSAPAERVSFTPFVLSRINDWVAERTNYKISNLIPERGVGPDTALVLANAIYFQGSWISPFLEEKTTPRPFYLENGEEKTVPTMHQSSPLFYYEDDAIQAVTLPFVRGPQSASEPICLLILAKDPEKKVSFHNLHTILTEQRKANVHLQVPKFKVETSLSPVKHLKEAGLVQAFTPNADFSKMSPTPGLFISNIFHKAFFLFEEKGVEAAAATALIMSTTSLKPRPEKEVSFNACRPFYFLLLDQKTETPLFLGKIHNPQL